MDQRQVLRLIAAGRFVTGLLLLVMPGQIARRWIGDAGGRREVKVLSRAMGARDIGLAVGTMRSLERGEPAATWAVASAWSDIADAAASLLAMRAAGRRRAIGVAFLGATAAAFGLYAARELDDAAR